MTQEQEQHPVEQLRILAKQSSLDTFSESFCAFLDATDGLKNKRDQFYIPLKKHLVPGGKEGESIYLCGNSLGLQPRTLRSRIEEELLMWQNVGVVGHFSGERPWLKIDEFVLPAMARLVGALEEEVAVMGSLTSNIHTLMVPFYRPTQKRHKILIEKGAFPSDLYIATSQIAYHGFNESESLIQIEPRLGEYTLRTEDIVATINRNADSLALVLLPGLQYSTGQALDIARITSAAHKVGVCAGFDLAHSVGNVKLLLHDWSVDFACWCSYKYLNSGPGGIGGIFVHSKHANANLPRFAGWWGHHLETRFRMDSPYRPIPGAFGFRHSNPSVLTVMALLSSLEIFDSVGLSAVLCKQRLLTGYLELLLTEQLPVEQTIITPHDPSQRGCQLSILFKEGTDVKWLEHMLMQQGVVVDSRGRVMRVAPAPLYNTFTDVYRFVKMLKETLTSQQKPSRL